MSADQKKKISESEIRFIVKSFSEVPEMTTEAQGCEIHIIRQGRSKQQYALH